MRRTKDFLLASILLLFTGLTISTGQIQSADFHLLRDDLQNSYLKFAKKKKARVAFLGGSITYNPGWRDSVSVFIKHKFPNTDFEFINAGIPSMGSTPGAFRLERDILAKGKIDLLFVEAAVNDPTNGRSAVEQIRGMEGIVRHARKANSKTDIVMMYFADPDKIESYNNGKIPEVIFNHEVVANQYHISSINLAKEVTDRINAGEFTWKDDFKDLHPSPFGQQIYFQSIKSLLDYCWDNPESINVKVISHPMPEKMDEYCYDNGKLIGIEHTDIVKGWRIDPNWNPADSASTRSGYVDIPMLISETRGSELQFAFKGKAVGISVAAGPDAGIIEYSIDEGEFKKVDLYTKWSSHLHLPWYYVLEAELTAEKHKLAIRISESKHPESKGNACRIKQFFINEY